MTVKQVAVRELKSHLSRYLAEASAGAIIEVASHRRVVARVTGVAVPTDALAKMAAKGLLQLGSGMKPKGARFVLPGGGTPVSVMVLEDR